jgi:hypothetical protein
LCCLKVGWSSMSIWQYVHMTTWHKPRQTQSSNCLLLVFRWLSRWWIHHVVRFCFLLKPWCLVQMMDKTLIWPWLHILLLLYASRELKVFIAQSCGPHPKLRPQYCWCGKLHNSIAPQLQCDFNSRVRTAVGRIS